MLKKTWLLVITFIYIVFSFNSLYAAVIDEVRFEGNKRIPETRITPYLIKAGKELNIEEVNESLKRLYGTGLFLSVDTDLSVDGDKFVLTYKLEEMPIIGSIIYKGNKALKASKLKSPYASFLINSLKLLLRRLFLLDILPNWSDEKLTTSRKALSTNTSSATALFIPRLRLVII